MDKNIDMELAPIVLFAYNRPNHLERTLEALARNEWADQSTLYVYCDGPKDGASPECLARIKSVRDYVRSRQWCKDVIIRESDKNKGLGNSIISGVTEVILKHGKAIVLEDDLLTSPLFLDYMNKALDHYENRKSVFSISALSRPNPERFYPEDYGYDVYVSLVHHPTGWATWADRWKQVDWDVRHFKDIRDDVNIRNAFMRIGDEWYRELLLQQEQGLDVWSIRFAVAHFENHAVSICPVVSYINHIGWDSEATNAKASSRWNHTYLASKKEIRFLDVLYEDSRIINSWCSFAMRAPRTLVGKLRNAFGRVFLKRDEYALKKKVYAD